MSMQSISFVASKVLGAVSEKKLRLICLYPFLTTSQMITIKGMAVIEDNMHTIQKKNLSFNILLFIL